MSRFFSGIQKFRKQWKWEATTKFSGSGFTVTDFTYSPFLALDFSISFWNITE